MAYEFNGQEAADDSGWRIDSAGDLDGDGFDDLLISAYNADGVGNLETWSGSTYVIMNADLGDLDAADGFVDGIIDLGFVASIGTSYEIMGQDAADGAGYGMASAGDVDGDGTPDLLIGARSADGPGNSLNFSGEVFLINADDFAALDQADGMVDGIIDLAHVAGAGTSYQFLGPSSGDAAGGSVASVGDMDGDGLAEFVIGSTEFSQGTQYLINGADLGALDQADGEVDGIIDLGLVAGVGNSYTFVGEIFNDGAEWIASSAGDVDGDGNMDLLIGAPRAEGVDERLTFVGLGAVGEWVPINSGAAYLINADDLADLDAADGEVDGVISLEHVAATGTSYEFVGISHEDFAGYSVSSAGDVDGDGLDDLLIGATWANGLGILGFESGVTYLISGADLPALDAQDGVTDGLIELLYTTSLVSAGTGSSYRFTADRFDLVGYSVSEAGDVDGDGLADFLIGAPRSDGIGNASEDSGSAFLISGADLALLDALDPFNSPGTIDLNLIAGIGNSYQFVGEFENDNAGFQVSSAGDVDGDGLSDILISAVEQGTFGFGAFATGTTYLIEADQLAYYDGLDGSVDGVIDLGNVNCFLAGTAIATPDGPRAVEALAPGDPILTEDDRVVPVRFNLRQTVSTRFGPAERLQPVRVRAGALGGGLPERDLVLTADHALLIDGLLINAGALVNGSTIDWVPVSELGDSFTVYHVETEEHDIILAEGAPAETFIDYVGRQAFDNYAEYVALYGEERIITEAPYPRISTPRLLPPALKARLAGRVAA